MPLSGRLRSDRRRGRGLGGHCGRGDAPSNAVRMVGRAYVVGLFVDLVVVAAAAAIAVFLEQLGFWSYLAIAAGGYCRLPVSFASAYRPSEKETRSAGRRDGIVECGIRCKSLPPGPPPPAASCQRGWLIGYAKKENGSLIFQPRLSQVL
jgi:hypothetical protein